MIEICCLFAVDNLAGWTFVASLGIVCADMSGMYTFYINSKRTKLN